MKWQVLLLSLMVVGSYSIHGSADWDRLDQKLTNAAPRAFGNFMMFKDAVNPQGLAEWNAAIGEGKSLVKLANSNKKYQKKLNDYMRRIDNANNELINTIKLAYNSMFVPFVGITSLADGDRINNVNYKHKFEGIFLKIKNDMKALQQEVKKYKFLHKDIISLLATYIVNYTDNAINSMEYWLSQPKFYIDAQMMKDLYGGLGKPRPWMAARDR